MCMEIKVALGVNGQMRTEVAAGSSVFSFLFGELEPSSPARSHFLCFSALGFFLFEKYLQGNFNILEVNL